MAGDWIKMRADLREDPAVFAIAERLRIDELHVVGCLHAFWSWCDKHAVDGRVDRATSRLVDKASGHKGFADALVSVKWLEIIEGEGITIPNFDRHNGESAKERSLKNRRQAKWRDGKATTAPSTETSTSPSTQVSTATSTREEKRREEDQKQGGELVQAPLATRGTRLPPDWKPSDDLTAWAIAERPDVDMPRCIAEFVDYWRGVAGAKGVRLDWDATFRNAVRSDRAPLLRGKANGTPLRDAWWETDSGCDRKGVEVGIRSRPGETRDAFKARINDRLREASHAA